MAPQLPGLPLHPVRPQADFRFPSIGFNPAPGNPGSVDRLAFEFAEIAGKLAESEAALLRIGYSDGIWRGEAAEAFRGKVSELPSRLDRASSAMSDASKALYAWSDDLVSMQNTARQLEDQASVAKLHLERAREHPALAEGPRQVPLDQLAAAQARIDAAVSALNQAQAAFDEIIDRAEALFRQHSEIAEQVAAALARAADGAPEEDIFEQVGEFLDGFFDSIDETVSVVWTFIQDHAHVIGNLSDYCSNTSTLTVFFPPVSAALAAIAAAGHGTAYLAGDESTSWKTAAWDLGGLIPFGKVGTTIFTTSSISAPFVQQYGLEDNSQTTLWQDLNQYWKPRSPTQELLLALGIAGGPTLAAVPIWNAVADGIEEDKAAST